MLKVYKVSIDVDASGDSTDYSEGILGRLIMVYINDGDLADNWDMTFTYDNEIGDTVTLLTLTNQSTDLDVYPREQVHGNTGTGLTYDATRIVAEPPVVDGRIKIVTADGGVSKSGSVLLYIEK